MRAGCLFAYLFVGCAMSLPTQATAKTYWITIEQMRFRPPVLKVHPGDRVVWVNKDFVAHTASAVSKAFESNNIASNVSWSYIARSRGRYPYACQFHPTMRGELIIQ
jgi:plastocyanin